MERGGKMSTPSTSCLSVITVTSYISTLFVFFILFMIEPVNAKCILISTAAIAYFKALFLFR